MLWCLVAVNPDMLCQWSKSYHLQNTLSSICFCKRSSCSEVLCPPVYRDGVSLAARCIVEFTLNSPHLTDFMLIQNWCSD